ncbi:MAG TPA: hypothetical protein VIF09_15825, partial [Polyangiaceae bacterium]
PSVKARNTSAMAGIDKHITGSVTIGGVAYTPLTLRAVFVDDNTAIDSAEALHKQWQDQVVVTKAADAKAHAVFQSLRTWLIGQYGNNANAVLNDFGMQAPKTKGPKTVAVKSAAAKKSAATRQVRNTLGSVQKQAVKGAIQVPVKAVTTIVPVTPAPTATTTPASTTPAPATPAKPAG